MSRKKFFANDDISFKHKWGYKDSGFTLNEDRSVTMFGNRYDLCGTPMPDLIPYVEEVLGFKIDSDDLLPQIEDKPISEPTINEPFLNDIKSNFDLDRFTVANDDRLIHSHGQTTSEEVYKVLYNKIDTTVDMVFYPESEDEVQQIIQYASKHDVCIIPYGGGTSVSNALKLPENETRMMVAVDMRRMDKIEWVNEEDRRACIQAGITGTYMENELGKLGYMVGHEPDSVELSTLGGWIATHASGMKKNRYGNIEDIVKNVTMITPTGVIDQVSPIVRASIGMRPENFIYGNEGNLGIITKAIVKIHKKPEVQKYGSAVFPDWENGVQFLHELSQTNYIPASARLVDNIQFRFGQALKPKSSGFSKILDDIKKFFVLNIKGFDPHKMCAATFVMEGNAKEVAYQEKNLNALAVKHSGLAGGSENGKRGYMLTYAIAYVRDFLTDFHIIGETMETSVPWSNIQKVCDEATKTLYDLHEKHSIPGIPYMSYRIPQIYHTGVAIYFMFGLYIKGIDNAEILFGEIEHKIRQSIMDNGGSISHHHGVGKLRKDFMKDTLSDSSIDMIKNVKDSIDPNNIFGIKNNVFAD
jgi:alkyldihydroxyacetonephosphate synthase